jgi:hypothetical protein
VIFLLGLIALWDFWANKLSNIEIVVFCTLVMFFSTLGVLAVVYTQNQERTAPNTEGPVRCWDVECLASLTQRDDNLFGGRGSRA